MAFGCEGVNDMENNLKPIFLKNAYPLKLIEYQFLQNGPKPKPPEVTFTLCILYTSKNINFHMQKLTKHIKLVLPSFYIRLA